MCNTYYNLYVSCDHWFFLRTETCPNAPKCCDEYTEVKAIGDCPACAEEIEKALQLQIGEEITRAAGRLGAGHEADDEKEDGL